VFGGKLVPSFTAQYSSRYASQNASYICTRVGHDANGNDIPYVSGQGYCAAGSDNHVNGRFEENGWAQVNAQINWTDASDHYTIGVFANNLNNVRYYIIYSQPGYGKNIVYNEPRTFGVRAGVKF
jgi:outer membrane receptor protein involved in Fe transport